VPSVSLFAFGSHGGRAFGILGHMARDQDDEKPWTRQLLVVVGVLVAVALVIGGIVSVVALGAAKVTGLSSAKATATSKPSLYVPSEKPTVGLEPYPEPSGQASPNGSATEGSDSPDFSDSPGPKQKKNEITLQVYPQQVAPSQRINLTGLYTGGEGAKLQVQRFEGGSWSDFPVTTSVTGGQFSTYVTTSHTGPQRLRVADKAADRTSNAVRVTVR
jgi:hypothetical protein